MCGCAVLLLSLPALMLCMAPSAGSDSRTCSAETSASGLVDKVKEQNAKNSVIVYSKSYCPYCASVRPYLQICSHSAVTLGPIPTVRACGPFCLTAHAMTMQAVV